MTDRQSILLIDADADFATALAEQLALVVLHSWAMT
mgnify:CR=1 FL=1